MPNIGPFELIIVLVVALVVLGPKRLPEMGRQIGRAMREFRAATSEVRSELGIDELADEVTEIKSSLAVDDIRHDIKGVGSDLSLSTAPTTAPDADPAEPDPDRP